MPAEAAATVSFVIVPALVCGLVIGIYEAITLIKDVQVPDETKAMGRMYRVVSMFSTNCEEGQVERCVTVCEWPPEGEPYCYYICVCTEH